MIRLFALFIVVLALVGCAASTREEPATDLRSAEQVTAPLQVSDQRIVSASGRTLLTIDALPNEIPASREASFGAAAAFSGASASPRGEWLAVTTSGAAHSAGWLVHLGSSQIHPAAFQYGGSVRIGPWSNEGRYVAFILDTPKPSRRFVVVDRQNLRPTVESTAQGVEAPEETEAALELFGWREQKLLFEASGDFYAFDPATGQLQPITQGAPQLTAEQTSEANQIKLHAQGLPATTEVQVGFGPPNSEYELVSRARTDGSGNLSTTIQLPKWAEPGAELIFVVAIPETSAEVLSEALTVQE